MTFMILGGLGFLGQNLCRMLADYEKDIIVYNRESKHAHTVEESLTRDHIKHKVVWGNFEDEGSWEDKLKDVNLVFHLISTTKPSNTNMMYEFSSNVEASIRFLEMCAKLNVRVIFFSSGGTVYGMPRSLPIDELHATNPISTYGISKLAIEKCLVYYGYTKKLNYTILRIANPYGKGQNLNNLQGFIGISLSRALQGQDIEVWGDGNIIRDYIYMDDLMDAVKRVVLYNGNYRIFNVGYSKGYSINEIVSIIQRYINPRVFVKYKEGRIQDVSANILSHDLLRNETGWVPKVSIEEGIKRMIYSWDDDKKIFV